MLKRSSAYSLRKILLIWTIAGTSQTCTRLPIGGRWRSPNYQIFYGYNRTMAVSVSSWKSCSRRSVRLIAGVWLNPHVVKNRTSPIELHEREKHSLTERERWSEVALAPDLPKAAPSPRSTLGVFSSAETVQAALHAGPATTGSLDHPAACAEQSVTRTGFAEYRSPPPLPLFTTCLSASARANAASVAAACASSNAS